MQASWTRIKSLLIVHLPPGDGTDLLRVRGVFDDPVVALNLTSRRPAEDLPPLHAAVTNTGQARLTCGNQLPCAV